MITAQQWCGFTFATVMAAAPIMSVSAMDDAFRGDSVGSAFGVALESAIGGDATVGGQRIGWDSNTRYNATFRQRMRADGRAVPIGGVDIGYFDANSDDADDGTCHISGLMLGLTGGVELNLRGEPEFNSINIAIVPYLRGGIGWQQSYFNDFVDGDNEINSSIDTARFELGCGLDLALRIRNFQGSIGMGAQVWTIGSPVLRATEISSSDTEYIVRSISGNDTFVRLQFLFWM